MVIVFDVRGHYQEFITKGLSCLLLNIICFIINVGKALESVLGRPLPPDAQPSPNYVGPSRLIVPTVRSLLNGNEPLNIKAIVLSPQIIPSSVSLFCRELGHKNFTRYHLKLVTMHRQVYVVSIPPQRHDFEYYVQAIVGSKTLLFPVTAPKICQTVIVN